MLELNVNNMSVLSGKEFNEKYMGKKFVKLTNKEENHNGYEFKSGLNVDTEQFYPYGECHRGGIYFCEWGKLPMWLVYGDNRMVYVRLVSIPDDAQVYEEEDKWKADRLVLGEREEIGKLTVWDDVEYCMAAVRQNSHALEYVHNQTEKICLEAVRRNGSAVGYVKDQTEEICMAAVKRDCHALIHVKNQTEEICLAAVKQNGYVLQYVRNQREEICLEAVRRNGLALKYVKDQTEKICLAAVRENSGAWEYVR